MRAGAIAISTIARIFYQAFTRNTIPLSKDRTRLNNDDIYADRMQFHAQRVAKAFQREFGGVIPTAERLAELSADLGDVDDPPGTLRPHRRQHKLNQPRKAEYVDIELSAGLLRRDLDHVIVFSERHLRHLLLCYMKYYNCASEHPSFYVVEEKRLC